MTGGRRVDEIRVGGRNFLRAGDPCRVAGKRGLFRFVAAIVADDRAEVEVVGPLGPKTARMPLTRTLPVSQVRRVAKTRENVAAVAR